jgi:hypothetical protein
VLCYIILYYIILYYIISYHISYHIISYHIIYYIILYYIILYYIILYYIILYYIILYYILLIVSLLPKHRRCGRLLLRLIGLPWSSDRPIAEASTPQQTPNTSEVHSCPRTDFFFFCILLYCLCTSSVLVS